MKVIDIFGYAYHYLNKNKLRSLLTITVVLIIGFLVMALMSIGIFFTKNIHIVYKEIALTEKIYINSFKTDSITNDEYLRLKSLIAKNEQYISSISSKISFIYCTDYDFYDNILKNEIGIRKYKNTNAIFLSSSYENQYQIDDIFYLKIQNSYEFVVKGFYDEGLSEPYFIDLNYAIDNISDAGFDNIIVEASYDESINLNKMINVLNSLQDEMFKIFPNSAELTSGTYSEYLEMVKISKSYSTLTILIVSFISLTLLIMSIGSISNTIAIMVDENQKLLGLQKILGMKETDMKKLIYIECLLIIIIGTVLAVIFLSIFTSGINNIAVKLLDFVYEYANIKNRNQYSFNHLFYLPLINISFFTFFTLLFARKDLQRIINKSPIEIINEVD